MYQWSIPTEAFARAVVCQPSVAVWPIKSHAAHDSRGQQLVSDAILVLTLPKRDPITAVFDSFRRRSLPKGDGRGLDQRFAAFLHHSNTTTFFTSSVTSG